MSYHSSAFHGLHMFRLVKRQGAVGLSSSNILPQYLLLLLALSQAVSEGIAPSACHLPAERPGE